MSQYYEKYSKICKEGELASSFYILKSGRIRRIKDGVTCGFIEKGEIFGILGPNGAGKSTIVNILNTLVKPDDGTVIIDGINIKEYSLTSARSLMSIVTQEAILFNDTIANNIAIGHQGASEEEIIEAAKIANAHEFIV